MSRICIQSDFNDYYDILSDDKSALVYKRYMCDCKQRGTDLKYLRSIGIKTIELKQVSQFSSLDGNIVVYTDPKGHNGNGKKIMNVNEAMLNYSNCLASKYYETEDNFTIKYLQIGKRRFTLCFKKIDKLSLSPGILVDIKESSNEYNRLIGLPIFSIDYISNNNEMIATDFNEVQNLSSIGMQNYISPDNIMTEILESLAIYNKY